jgi:hypothetical protein
MQKTYTVARFAAPLEPLRGDALPGLNVLRPILKDWKNNLMTLAQAEGHAETMRKAGFNVVAFNTASE